METAQSRGEKASLQVELKPDIEQVSVIRRFVSEYYGSIGVCLDDCGRLAVATHELMQNLKRYSDAGSVKFTVTSQVGGARMPVRLVTENVATPAHVERLRNLFGALNAAEDVQALYVQLLRDSAAGRPRLGLGLVRVVAESELKLDLEVDHDVVRIIAHGEIARGGAPS